MSGKTIKIPDDKKIYTIISSYLNEIDSFWEDEDYKWIAVQHFQNNWDIEAANFKKMFEESTNKLDNLMVSTQYYPRGVLLDLLKYPEEMRSLFRVLYDEKKDLVERIITFQNKTTELAQKIPSVRRTYQDLRAVSTLLWLRFPDKYYIYKSREFRKTLNLIGWTITSSLNGKADTYPIILECMNKINEALINYNETKNKFANLLGNKNRYYSDKYLHTATIDFVFYCGKRYNQNKQSISIDNMTQNNIYDKMLEDYKFFLENCTSISSTTVRNYTDFKRINECIKALNLNKQKLLDFSDPDELIEVIGLLEKQKEFKDIEEKGHKQYSNTIKNYLFFLIARKHFSSKESYYTIKNTCLKQPQQIIFYGAPGTGKSFHIKVDVDDKKRKNFRTTFHPDSDYSTFVGAYKPTMQNRSKRQTILDYDALVDKLKEYINEQQQNITKACTLFGFDFHDSIVRMQEETKKSISQLVIDGYKSGTTYDTQVRAGMSAYENSGIDKIDGEIIVYSFVPQAFLKAYTEAWKNQNEPVFLIIEEINRGNCAQIFGDLFQLLDRDDKTGLSVYPISPDEDIQKFLLSDKKFGFADLSDSQKAAIPPEVLSGELLILPSNLYIWATMNTSDQSLFPIDSAFKRRWNWHYMPISNANLGWQIEANGNRYDWWDFLEKINEKIGSTTNSEDKKLGYFFCKAKNDVIDADMFVAKVIFYVWNDVFKDFADEAGSLFKDDDGSLLSFNKFFATSGNGKTWVVEKKVEQLLKNLGLEPVEKIERKFFGDATFNRGHLKVTFPKENLTIEYNVSTETFVKFVEYVTPERISSLSLKAYERNDYPLVSTVEPDVQSRMIGDSGYYLVTKFGVPEMRKRMELIAKGLNLNCVIEEVNIPTVND